MVVRAKRKSVKRAVGKKVVRKKAKSGLGLRAKKLLTETGLKYKLKFRKQGLPTSLSGWIVAAVKDARRLEKNPNFVLDMSRFNDLVLDGRTLLEGRASKKRGRAKCHVCLGGAAIVGRGLVKPGDDTNGDMSTAVAHALDYVRMGDIQSALYNMYSGTQELSGGFNEKLVQIESRVEKEYDAAVGARADWATYLQAAKELKALGL